MLLFTVEVVRREHFIISNNTGATEKPLCGYFHIQVLTLGAIPAEMAVDVALSDGGNHTSER